MPSATEGPPSGSPSSWEAPVRRHRGDALVAAGLQPCRHASRSRCRSGPIDGPAGQRDVGSACHKAVPHQSQASPRLPKSRPAGTADRSCPSTPQVPRSPRASTPAYPSPAPSLGSTSSIRYVSSWRRSPRSWFAIRNLKPSGLRRSTPASLFQQRQGHSDQNLFLSNNRALELRTLDNLIPPLCNYQYPLHMITLVSKQDLWWKNRHEAQNHYENAEYAQKVQAIYTAKGHANFTHHFSSVSFGQINFDTADRHRLFETSAGYDNVVLTANFNNFLDMLKQLAG